MMGVCGLTVQMMPKPAPPPENVSLSAVRYVTQNPLTVVVKQQLSVLPISLKANPRLLDTILLEQNELEKKSMNHSNMGFMVYRPKPRKLFRIRFKISSAKFPAQKQNGMSYERTVVHRLE